MSRSGQGGDKAVWLWITLLVLAVLIVLLGRVRLGVLAELSQEQLRLDVTIGPFHFRVLPGRPDGESEKSEPQEKTARSPDGAGAAPPRPGITFRQVRAAGAALWPLFKKALERTRRGVRVHPLEVSVTVGGALDPAAAAELYGYLHMGVWTVMPALEQLISIPDPHIHVGVDFDAPKTRAEGRAGISLRLGTLLAIVTETGVPALQWLLRQRKEQKQQPPPAKQPAAGRPAA